MLNWQPLAALNSIDLNSRSNVKNRELNIWHWRRDNPNKKGLGNAAQIPAINPFHATNEPKS